MSNITVDLLFCTIQHAHDDSLFIPEFIVTMIATGGGVASTLLAIACVVTNTTMDPSYRSILLSFSIANVLGTAMLAYDTISLICKHSTERLSFVITISVMLSLSHLFMLTIDQWNMLQQKNRSARDFTGLILILWIISITIGMMNVVSDETRLAFALVFLLCLTFLLASFCFIISKHFHQKRLKRGYQSKYLAMNKTSTKTFQKYWMLEYFGVMIISYAMTSVMWGVNEVRESVNPANEIPLLHSATLILYSLNFYFPSGICIYLRFLEFMIRRGRFSKRIQSSYRFRDTY